MVTFINAQVVGQVHKPVVVAKSAGNGKEYVKFILKCLNPRVGGAKMMNMAFVECTVWESGFIKTFLTEGVKEGDFVFADGQMLIETYNGNRYVKLLVRNAYNLSYDKNKESKEEYFSSGTPETKTFNGEAEIVNVSDEDYDKNF